MTPEPLSIPDKAAILAAILVVLYLAAVVTGTAYTGASTAGYFTNPPDPISTYLNWSVAALVLALVVYGARRASQ